MADLLSQARFTKTTRDDQYPDWRETAHRYCEGDPARYPADMIRAKLARDPDCRREDTRVDLVNYLAMLDEHYRGEPVQDDEPFETTTEKVSRLMKSHRDRMRAELGAEL